MGAVNADKLLSHSRLNLIKSSTNVSWRLSSTTLGTRAGPCQACRQSRSMFVMGHQASIVEPDLSIHFAASTSNVVHLGGCDTACRTIFYCHKLKQQASARPSSSNRLDSIGTNRDRDSDFHWWHAGQHSLSTTSG